MGQYYYIVNLDKQQIICPRAFGDGIKLMEFGSSGQGAMCALAVLLSSGNGRGGGDILGLDNIPKRHRLQQEAAKMVGSWEGDRIVIAGDYADNLLHLTRKQQRHYKKQMPIILKEELENWKPAFHMDERQRAEINFRLNLSRVKNNQFNLYDYASRFFTDISDMALRMILLDNYLLQDYISNAAKGYNHYPAKWLKKRIKKQKDLLETTVEEIFNNL